MQPHAHPSRHTCTPIQTHTHIHTHQTPTPKRQELQTFAVRDALTHARTHPNLQIHTQRFTFDTYNHFNAHGLTKLTKRDGDCTAKNKKAQNPVKTHTTTRQGDSRSYARTHTRTHARTHARTRAKKKNQVTTATELLTLEFTLLCLFSMRTGAVTCPAFFF